MSTNKNASIRYQELDKCFRNSGKKYYVEDLLEACNARLEEYNGEQSKIERRQLYNDIKYMESEAGWSIPLEKIRDGKRVYYRYSDLNFSINNLPLKESDLRDLQAGMQVLAKIQGLPQLESLQEILDRLQGENSPNNMQPLISFDENPYLRGLSHLGDLFAAILYQKVLRVQYQDFKSPEPYELVFHPYHLKQYNNRWFVIGYHEANDFPTWNLALDRIHSLEDTQLPYRKHQIDWQDFFEDIIGVTKPLDREPIAITCWFDEETAPYIETKPLHGSQKKIPHTRGQGLMIRLHLIPNYEFYQRILSFGKNVEVLEPQEVVAEMQQILEGALGRYK